MLILIGYIPPFQSLMSNQLEIFNEVCVLITNYHSMMFTDFLSDVDMREKVGTSLVYFTGLGVLINLACLFGSNLQILLRKLKLNFMKLKRYAEIR